MNHTFNAVQPTAGLSLAAFTYCEPNTAQAGIGKIGPPPRRRRTHADLRLRHNYVYTHKDTTEAARSQWPDSNRRSSISADTMMLSCVMDRTHLFTAALQVREAKAIVVLIATRHQPSLGKTIQLSGAANVIYMPRFDSINFGVSGFLTSMCLTSLRAFLVAA